MGDGGSAQMQMEIGKDDARDPSGEFIERGENVFKQNLTWSNFSEMIATFSEI